MRVTAWVECQHEVAVEIGAEEVIAALTTRPDDAQGETWGEVLNRFGTCLRGIPDDLLATWSPARNETIAAFLSEQAERFRRHGKVRTAATRRPQGEVG